MALVSSPAAGFGADLTANAGLAYDVSSADTLQQLAGPFVFVALGADVGFGVGVVVYFTAPGTGSPGPFVYGAEFEVTVGAGVELYLGVNDTTVVGLGWARGAADQIWNASAALGAYQDAFEIHGAELLAKAKEVYNDQKGCPKSK
jgi:hypothetical protein